MRTIDAKAWCEIRTRRNGTSTPASISRDRTGITRWPRVVVEAARREGRLPLRRDVNNVGIQRS